ncbi:MAG: atpC 1 [Thermoleophilia bacterium]|nr:atpC 1 [Thermoleophilia bacterium]
MASTYQLFPVKVVTPEGVLFDGEVRELEVTSVSGGMGILARRAPVVADLKLGQVRAELEDGTWKTWATEEGFVQSSNSTATVVVEDAIALEDVTAAAAAELVSEGKAKLDAAGDDEADAKAARREIAWGEHLAAFKHQHG